MCSEGMGVTDLEQLCSRLYNVFARESAQAKIDITPALTILEFTANAVKDFKAFSAEAGNSEPNIRIARLGCFEGNGRSLKTDDPNYPPVLSVGQLHLAHKNGFSALTSNPRDLYLKVSSVEELDAAILLGFLCSGQPHLITSLAPDSNILPERATFANLPMIHGACDVVMPQVIGRLFLNFTFMASNMLGVGLPGSLREALGSVTMFPSHNALRQDLQGERIRGQLDENHPDELAHLIFGAENTDIRADKLLGLLRTAADLLYAQKFGEPHQVRNAKCMAQRLACRVLGPAPHISIESMKADRKRRLMCCRYAGFRSAFSLGEPLADTKKISMAMYFFEVDVPGAAPDNCLNASMYKDRLWLQARAYCSLARAVAEQEYFSWSVPSCQALAYILGCTSINPAQRMDVAHTLHSRRIATTGLASELDAKLCNLISQLFNISTLDDSLAGPFAGRDRAIWYDWLSDSAHDAGGQPAQDERDHFSKPFNHSGIPFTDWMTVAVEPSRTELRSIVDQLPIQIDPLACAGMVDHKTLLSFRIEDSDNVGLAEFIRDGRADAIANIALAPESWDTFDEAPHSAELNVKLTICNAIFGTQFARKEARRSRPSADQAPDSFEIKGVPTTRRRRENDHRQPQMRSMPHASQQRRLLELTGDNFSFMANPDDIGVGPRSYPAGPVLGSYNIMAQRVPYSYPNDYYLVPSVYSDSSVAFMERHESRLENLTIQGAPKVRMTVCRSDAHNSGGSTARYNEFDDDWV